jgi:hypothetical protein
MFASQSQIVESFNKLSLKGVKINSFIGIVLFLIHGERLKNNYISVNMRNFQKHLDDVLYLNKEKPERNVEKKWFVLFRENWQEQIKIFLLDGKKISGSDFALVLYWTKNFAENETPLSYLKSSINNDLFFDSIFLQDDSVEINSNELADVAKLHTELGGGNDFTYKIDKKVFIESSAGDLGSAPFSQTMYSNLEYRNCFFVADYDFFEPFGLGKSNKLSSVKTTNEDQIALPKPFLLLAGISGTGKSRFVRNQAERDVGIKNYLLIPVRPDWHEPSDLLGYVSRIGDVTKYVPTPFLVFVVQAWKSIFLSCQIGETSDKSEFTLKPLNNLPTYWVCLDEMNLAPVEQYFADYLSVVESRKWTDGRYSCASLVNPVELLNGESQTTFQALRTSLGLDDNEDLWNCFLKVGIPIPPNLIVAGTVNMDETTHGFSRKVIDRALTIDFGDFFPNDFNKYFSGQNNPKSLTFPRFSHSTKNDLQNLVAADPDGALSTIFMKEVNQTLKGTSFEMAFRALNELLISLLCFMPKNNAELMAVWDDFLMFKLLPRLEGDEEKLLNSNDKNVIDELLSLVEEKLKCDPDQPFRIDLLNTSETGQQLLIPFRSPVKLRWMRKRLTAGYTSFWP